MGLWLRLTQPSDLVVDPGTRRQARFAAAVSIFTLVLGGLLLLIALRMRDLPSVFILFGLLILAVLAYRSSRSIHPQQGAILLVYGLTIFAFLASAFGFANPGTLLYGVVSVALVLSAALLSLRWQIGLLFGVLAGSLVLGRAVSVNPEITTSLALLGVVLIITSSIRDQVERHRLEALNQEITRRRAIESELRRSEERFAKIFDVSPDPLVLSQVADGKMLDANTSFVHTMGYSREEIIGRTVFELEMYVDPANRLEMVRLLAEHGELHDFEVQLRRKDGSTFFANASISPLELEGKPCLVWMARDVTQQKQAEATLRESETRYRRAIEAADAVLYYQNFETMDFDFIGDGILAMTGYTPEEITSSIFLSLVVERVLEGETAKYGSFSDASQHAIKGEISIWKTNNLIVRRDGQKRWIMDSAVQVFDEHEKPAGMIGILQDITERKQAEDALRASESSYRGLFDSVAEAIYIQDHQGMFLDVNQGAVQMYGYPREWFAGKTPLMLSAPGKNDLEKIGEAVKLAFAGKPQQFEFWGLRANGEIFPKDVRLYKGVYFGQDVVIALAQDITERKRSDAALRVSEEKFNKAFRSSPTAMLITSLENGRYLEINDAFSRDTGYFRSEVIGHTTEELNLWLDPIPIRETLLTLGEISGVEAHFRRKSGEIGVALISAVLIELNGILCGLYSVPDITRRKLAEEDLRARDRILEAITFAAEQFLSVPDWQANMNGILEQLGRVMNASHAYVFEHHLNANGDIVASMTFEWVAPGHDPAIDFPDYQDSDLLVKGFERYFETLRQGKAFVAGISTYSSAEAEYLLGQGIKALLEVPIFIGDEWWGTMGFDDCEQERDWSVAEIDALKIAAKLISTAIHRQRAEQAVHTLNEQLEQRVIARTAQLAATNQELEAFSYSISHDLRAPLRSIDGFSSLLADEFSPILGQTGQQYLSRIRAGAQRMNHLIDDLLAFSRLSRQELRKVPVEPGTLARQVWEDMRPALSGRLVEITIAEDFPICQADASLLWQVFANLLENAIKFTRGKEQARIEVGWQIQEGETVYFVRDNGAGFDMQYASKLFGVFQRLHRQDEFEGTGVGLANVKRIITRHGGRVWAKGELNQGTVIFFTLGKEDGSE